MGIFFVMEICEGSSLQQLLEEVCELHDVVERTAYNATFRRYFRQVSYAVTYIHSRAPPVLHRDLKPDNILLKPGSESVSCVKLIDFGLACLKESREDDVVTLSQVGTPCFMAPECFTRDPEEKRMCFTEEMDIWALGTIFCWMITAMGMGSLQHPMLTLEAGVGFDVQPMPDLYYAYKKKTPWKRELFDGYRCCSQHDEALDLADRIFVYESGKRATASDLMEHAWLRQGDLATEACAAILRRKSAIGNLTSYQSLNSLDKKILMLVAEHAEEESTMQLRRTFRALDTNMDGRLSFEELLEGFRRGGVQLTPEVLKQLTQFFEKCFLDSASTGENCINYQDWLTATIGEEILCTDDAAVQKAFQSMDVSGTGTISRQDLSVAIGNLARRGQEEIDQILTHLPQVLTLEGFSNLVRKVGSKRKRGCTFQNLDAV
jgi:serine/threonine protein kinase